MGRLIGTLVQVESDLIVICNLAAAYWTQQGHTVIDTSEGRAVVGKNAATGEDNPEALTTRWDTPRPVNFTVDEETGEIIPDDDTEWYCESPSGDPRFVDWRDWIPEGVVIQCEEVE